MVSSFSNGIRRVRSAPSLIAGVFVVTLLTAAPLAMAVAGMVEAHLGASLEAGNVWADRRDIGSDLLLNGSVFVAVDSPFGPLFLGYGRAQGGDSAIHLTFGSLLRP